MTYNLGERAVKSTFKALIQVTLLAWIIERLLVTSRVLPGDYSISDFCARDNTTDYRLSKYKLFNKYDHE